MPQAADAAAAGLIAPTNKAHQGTETTPDSRLWQQPRQTFLHSHKHVHMQGRGTQTHREDCKNDCSTNKVVLGMLLAAAHTQQRSNQN
jgi:hypothetical protein